MLETIEEIMSRVGKSQKNYEQNIKNIEKILIDERGYVSKIPKNKQVVVLCSGGLDSSILINKIIEEWNVLVYPLFFKRGARAQKFEEEAFDFFVDFYKKRFPKNMTKGFKLNDPIPPTEIKKNLPKELALTQGHPLRNSSMQNLAVMYAVSLNKKADINTILTGSIAEDNTEPELGLLSLRAQTLNTCIQTADWKWEITSPLTDPYLTKRPVCKIDLIEYAKQKDIPLEKTRTCFSSDKIADGKCFGCQKRLKAFKYIKIKDPLSYKGRREK